MHILPWLTKPSMQPFDYTFKTMASDISSSKNVSSYKENWIKTVKTLKKKLQKWYSNAYANEIKPDAFVK